MLQKELEALKNPRTFDLIKFNETMAREPRPGAKADILYVRDCPDCIFLAMIWNRGALTKRGVHSLSSAFEIPYTLPKSSAGHD